jgi:hypothetical protein
MYERAKAYDDSHAHHHAMLRTIALRTAALTLAAVRFAHQPFATANSTLNYYYCHRQFNLRCQISVCDYKPEIAPLRYAPTGDSFGYNMMTVARQTTMRVLLTSTHINHNRKEQDMSTDERIALQLERKGIDVESDDGARLYQEYLERAVERERKRNWHQPPPPTERVNGFRI